MVRILTAIACTMGITFFLYGVVSGRPCGSTWCS